jgi:hypothetical protein
MVAWVWGLGLDLGPGFNDFDSFAQTTFLSLLLLSFSSSSYPFLHPWLCLDWLQHAFLCYFDSVVSLASFELYICISDVQISKMIPFIT